MPLVRSTGVWTIRPLGDYSRHDLRLALHIFHALDRGNLYLA